MGEIGIRDLSRFTTQEWVPPIGAMGGPPAHELYRDLVRYAGLRLFRDADGGPRVEIHDGEHRRCFRVPSDDFRGALDRFRMRRAHRPVPDPELAELTRIIQARVSDPDVLIPTYAEETPDPPAPTVVITSAFTPLPPVPSSPPSAEEEIEEMVEELDIHRTPSSGFLHRSKAPSAWTDVVEPRSPPSPVGVNPSISGARAAPPPDGALPRYVRAFRILLHNGGWLGTTTEIAELTGDAPDRVIDSLRAYGPDLAKQEIAVAPVETKDGWRWLAVDLHKMASSQRLADLTAVR